MVVGAVGRLSAKGSSLYSGSVSGGSVSGAGVVSSGFAVVGAAVVSSGFTGSVGFVWQAAREKIMTAAMSSARILENFFMSYFLLFYLLQLLYCSHLS